jgi:hypothetical protein
MQKIFLYSIIAILALGTASVAIQFAQDPEPASINIAATGTPRAPSLIKAAEFPIFPEPIFATSSTNTEIIALKYPNGEGLLNLETRQFIFKPTSPQPTKEASHVIAQPGVRIDEHQIKSRRIISDLKLSSALKTTATSSLQVNIFNENDKWIWISYAIGYPEHGLARYNKKASTWQTWPTNKITLSEKGDQWYGEKVIINDDLYILKDSVVYHFNNKTGTWSQAGSDATNKSNGYAKGLTTIGTKLYIIKSKGYNSCDIDILDTATNKTIGIVSEYANSVGTSTTDIGLSLCSAKPDPEHKRLILIGKREIPGEGRINDTGISVYETDTNKFSYYPYSEIYKNFIGYNPSTISTGKQGALISGDSGLYFWDSTKNTTQYLTRSLYDKRDYSGYFHPTPILLDNRAFIFHTLSCRNSGCGSAGDRTTIDIFNIENGEKVDSITINGKHVYRLWVESSGVIFADINTSSRGGLSGTHKFDLDKRDFVYIKPTPQAKASSVVDPSDTYTITPGARNRESITLSITNANASSTVIIPITASNSPASYVGLSDLRFDKLNPHIVWIPAPNELIRYDLNKMSYERFSLPDNSSARLQGAGGEFVVLVISGKMVIYRIAR